MTVKCITFDDAEVISTFSSIDYTFVEGYDTIALVRRKIYYNCTFGGSVGWNNYFVQKPTFPIKNNKFLLLLRTTPV